MMNTIMQVKTPPSNETCTKASFEQHHTLKFCCLKIRRMAERTLPIQTIALLIFRYPSWKVFVTVV